MSGIHRIPVSGILLGIALLLSSWSPAAAAWEPPRVYIRNFQVTLLGKQALSGDEGAMSEQLAFCLAQRLQQRYPCARVLTENDFKSMIGWDRQQNLLGTPQEDTIGLDRILDAFGKSIIIDGSISGTASGYHVTLRAINSFGKNPRVNKSVKTGNAPLSADSFFALCDEIGDDLKLGICTWSGSVSLKISGNDQVNETESHKNGSASNSVHQSALLTLDVTLKGEDEEHEESQTAKYNYSFERTETSRQDITISCPTDDGKPVNKPYHSMNRSTSSASRAGSLEGKSASITLDSKTREFEIVVHVPEVDGETEVTVQEQEDGGCPGVRNRSDQSFKNPGPLLNAQSFSVKDYFNSKEGRLKGQKRLEGVALFPYTNTPNEGTLIYDLKRR